MSHSRKDGVESSILAFLNNLPSTANICFDDTINSNVKYMNINGLRGKRMLYDIVLQLPLTR